MVIVFAVSSTDQVAAFVPSWGASGAPHPSASTPACHASFHVSEPITFLNEPFALKTYSSSKKQARVVVASSKVFAHQPISPTAGPTPNAPATGDNFHVPSIVCANGIELKNIKVSKLINDFFMIYFSLKRLLFMFLTHR